jgi:hypothetical protein
MTINNNECNYKLHEFSGDSLEHQQLFDLYLRFCARSQPLPSKGRTFSEQRKESEAYFSKLVETNKIIFATQNNKIIGFISFDFGLKTLHIPETLRTFIQSKPQSQYCEFVFAASDSNLLLLKEAAHGIFQLLKQKYQVLYIVGNINREHKKNKYIKTIQRIFGFKVFQDFAYYEVP